MMEVVSYLNVSFNVEFIQCLFMWKKTFDPILPSDPSPLGTTARSITVDSVHITAV